MSTIFKIEKRKKKTNIKNNYLDKIGKLIKIKLMKKNSQKKIKYSYFSNIRFVYKILFKTNKSYIFLIPFTIILSLISVILSSYLASFIIYLLETKYNIYDLIIYICSIILLYLIIQAILRYLENILAMGYTLTRATIPFKDILDFSLRMDYQLYETKEIRDKFSKAEIAIGSNNQGVEGLYHNIPELIKAILILFIFGLTSLLISPIIFIIVLLSVILNILILYFICKKNNKIEERIGEINNKAEYFYKISEKESEAKDIRNYSLAHKFKEIIDIYSKELKRLNLKFNLYWALPSLELSIFSLIRDLLAYAILIYQAVEGKINVSEFSALLATVTTFNSYIDLIANYLNHSYSCANKVSFLREYYEIDNIFNHQNKSDLSFLASPFDIEIKNMSFKYPNSDNYIFKDFSLKIRKNGKVAIVGINGAGKTTLAKLLVGLYYPTSGEILINGHNLKEFNVDDYYKYVSIVNQDIIPFAFTIKENIISSYSFNKERFDKVIKEAGLKEKIDSLKNKENTYLTQNFDRNGVNLSGGEIQKMLLARALYKDSYFLILDEPTSALDPLAEGELYEKYNQLTNNKTSIFISHRLSSTRFCDSIYFIENGKIIESGTHQELMAKKGEYFKMFNIQAQYYQENNANLGEIYENS